MPVPPDDVHSKDLLFLLAENSNDVVWTMAVTGEITYVSPSVERMRGITPEQAMRQPLDKIFPPDSAAVVVGYFQELHAAMAEGRGPVDNFRGELEYFCADGSTVWTEVQVMPRYGPGGELLEILGVSRDISERRAQEDLIREARLQVERQRTLTGERERIARDLHDDLMQALSAAGIEIATAELRAGDDARALEALSRSREDLQAALDSARRMVTGLRARQLEGRTLAEALLLLTEEFGDRTGVAVTFGADNGMEGLGDPADEALFRVAQQALVNVAQHSGASTVAVVLSRDADDIVLDISDDGCGFDDAATVRPDAFGLVGMAERMASVGGSLVVESAPDRGARVVARMPAADQSGASLLDDR